MLHQLIAAAALAFPLPSDAVASHAPAAPIASQRVVIPFDPPLGRSLRYRVTQHNTGDPVSLVMNVRFSRTPTGYRLASHYDLPADVTSNPQLALLSRPLVLEMNGDGDFTAIVDEASWLRDSEALVATLVGDRVGTAVMRRMADTIRAMPPEGRVALFARNQQPITEFVGTEAVIGEAIDNSMPAGGPLGIIDQDFSLRLEALEGNHARFRIVFQIRPDQFAQLIGTLREFAGPVAQSLRELANLRGERVALYEVDTKTGLTRRHVSTVRITGLPTGELNRQVLLIEQLPD